MAYDVERPLRERIKHARLPEDVERGIGGLHLAASGIDCRSEAILRWAYGRAWGRWNHLNPKLIDYRPEALTPKPSLPSTPKLGRNPQTPSLHRNSTYRIEAETRCQASGWSQNLKLQIFSEPHRGLIRLVGPAGVTQNQGWVGKASAFPD